MRRSIFVPRTDFISIRPFVFRSYGSIMLMDLLDPLNSRRSPWKTSTHRPNQRNKSDSSVGLGQWLNALELSNFPTTYRLDVWHRSIIRSFPTLLFEFGPSRIRESPAPKPPKRNFTFDGTVCKAKKMELWLWWKSMAIVNEMETRILQNVLGYNRPLIRFQQWYAVKKGCLLILRKT